jgi:hypothetical protein
MALPPNHGNPDFLASLIYNHNHQLLLNTLNTFPNSILQQNLSLRDEYNRTLLHIACVENCPLAVVQAIAHISSNHDTGLAPHALTSLRLILTTNSLVKSADALGNLPLHTSLKYSRDADVTKLLILCYPNALFVSTVFGLTCTDLCRSDECRMLVQACVEAVEQGDMERLNQLCKPGSPKKSSPPAASKAMRTRRVRVEKSAIYDADVLGGGLLGGGLGTSPWPQRATVPLPCDTYVMCHYQGGKERYRGVITAVHEKQGTVRMEYHYDIKYDNGITESNLSRKFIKPLSRSAGKQLLSLFEPRPQLEFEQIEPQNPLSLSSPSSVTIGCQICFQNIDAADTLLCDGCDR